MRVALVLMLAGCGRIDFDEIDVASAPLMITKLRIHDPSTAAALFDITTGGAFDVSAYPNGITVVAEVAGSPGSVAFVRNGTRNVELSPPYVSGGNMGGLHTDLAFVVGTNELAVTAYELADMGGASGTTRAVTFELTLPLAGPPSIQHAGITNDDDTSFVEIVDGMTYSAASLPAIANVRIVTIPAFVGSVTIGGSAPWGARVENHPPYTAMATGESFTPKIGMNYTLTAQAFTLGKGLGTGGTPYTVTFSIGP
ncbi:MAG: hypothetical protein M4D80_19515 [Myxococcota bacterium]|nr:hypothetical protein [Myxococcota bacterium]